MKVLFYSYAYPNPLQPGLGTFNRSMISGLALDHEVRAVSPVPFTDVWKARLKGKLPGGLNSPTFSAVPGVPAEYLTYYYTPRLMREQYGRWMDWSVRRRFERTMKEFRPDVVLSYWAHPDGEVAVRTAHRHNVPAVVMVGGSDVLLLGRSGLRRQKILDVLHNADAVVTVSQNISDTLVADGIDAGKLHTVRRGVDRAMFSPGDQQVARRGLGVPETGSVIVCVGRLVPVKGHVHLLQACRQLMKRNVQLRCYIVGDGPLREELQKQITSDGLQDVVELRGSQTQSQLAEWYRAANVTVLSSLSEGVPNVLMESISCGTPFVATDVGGIPEIADSRHDRLVPTASPIAMADAIEWQLKVQRDGLPTRSFEPLTLRASAQRLARLLEDVRAKNDNSTPTQWESFRPVTPAASRGSSQGRDAEAVKSSSVAEMGVATSAVAATHPQTAEQLSMEATNVCAGELGRTGQALVLPRTSL